MLNRIGIWTGVAFLMISFFSSVYGFTLLTREEAINKTFGSKAEISIETHELEGDLLEAVKERLGGMLVYYQEGSESEIVSEKRTIEFIFAAHNGKKYGVGIIDIEPGKWGPVEFMIAMNMKGVIKSVRVLSYQEKRGRPIARNSYMNQFKNKTINDPITIGRDITGITGATISSRSSCFTVKKALVLYEEIYLKK